MPKKRHHNYLKSPQALSSSSGGGKDKPQRSVNELLSQLRYTSLASSSASRPAVSSLLPANTPTVPPDLRHILQIPETPAPRPRRTVRPRFDSNGRRLPAGPPPPPSWTSSAHHRQSDSIASSGAASAGRNALANISLPGLPQPASMSLIGLVVARLASNWQLHRVYDQHYLYNIPSHLKPALMRQLGVFSDAGLALGDLKTLLLRRSEAESESGSDHGGGVRSPLAVDSDITALDLTGALGRSLTLRDVTAFLFPARSITPVPEEPQDSWDAIEEAVTPMPSHALLPNITHLSLAVNPELREAASWRDLLALAPRLGSVTHLSLAYWPEPCFLQSAKFATVSSPQGNRIPYSGTNYYSHSIDHDWSEALLVLKKLSQSLYTLEFLDLTGCASWFKALKLEDDHDYVDWVSHWGKITHLRLGMGWNLADDAEPSARTAHLEAEEMATSVERHIIAARGGRGRFITVDR
ncbi:hypothetical protein NLG97_g6169 [Lecanicillium saksenae]|uniref:Uncharacterized protein n=1 Tax=Lecanicillium saksenae TaxID=468837 RepID=A0ACC1QS96_9HYPO|nr:hypothetical protein NLG97_g6169 [Lecanicillium saksenae]